MTLAAGAVLFRGYSAELAQVKPAPMLWLRVMDSFLLLNEAQNRRLTGIVLVVTMTVRRSR